mmetsp:Transcript_5190/g.7968  ORF Transcript_5190/g.7968 Transcript_5190/m.7968 type:complete len:377 (-) Transcript_5190:103-1233(-)
MQNSDMERINRILALIQCGKIESDGHQPHTQLKAEIRKSCPQLIDNCTSDAEVSQWLSLSKRISENKENIQAVLETLNHFLCTRSYLVNTAFSVADVAVFECLQVHIKEIPTYPEVYRWILHISSLCTGCTGVVGRQISPTLFPVLGKHTLPEAAQKSVADGKKVVKKDKTVDNSSVAANSKGGETTKPKAEKAAKPKEKKPAPSNPASSELDPSKLDFRVGRIVRCWEHPDAEKLLCEEIDLGESTGHRSIASGLRAHYKPEEMEGRLVIVLANLKDRTMVGFKSQGMVVCASNVDHSVVKLLEPPENAAVGDRVTFDGFDGEPAAPSAVAKKKILEKILPDMRTSEDGVAMWSSHVFKIGNGVCKAPLGNATVG